MEYKVTFKSMAGIALVITILASLLLYGGIVYHDLLLVFVAVAIVSTLIAIRIRYRVYIDSQLIKCRNVFGNKVILLSKITQCCWMRDYGYPKDRFYGPMVYEVSSSNVTVRINFKLFSIGCGQDILETTKIFLTNKPK